MVGAISTSSGPVLSQYEVGEANIDFDTVAALASRNDD